MVFYLFLFVCLHFVSFFFFHIGASEQAQPCLPALSQDPGSLGKGVLSKSSPPHTCMPWGEGRVQIAAPRFVLGGLGLGACGGVGRGGRETQGPGRGESQGAPPNPPGRRRAPAPLLSTLGRILRATGAAFAETPSRSLVASKAGG